MSDTIIIFLSLCFLIGAFVATRYGIAWKLKGASRDILRELERKGAVDVFTAVDLSRFKRNILWLGTRDYHAQALDCMVSEGVIGRTGAGNYYLRVPTERRGGSIEREEGSP
ncbi:MAG: hypothetical protein AB1646_21555 [Thermodesulfobacteriota bacterium]